jgi:hypothetical protein
MIDLKRYYRLHPQQLCWVEKSDKEGSEYVVFFKRFDNETGQEVFPREPQYATLKSLLKDRESLITQLEALNSILEDIDKL